MNIGYVKVIQPKNPLLKPLIKGYYVHACDDTDFYTKVTFYQNITTTLSIYKHSQTHSEGRVRHQHFYKQRGYTTLLAGLVDKYQEVHFHGPLNRLAIVFYPLGINHFISVPLSELLQKHYAHFTHYEADFEEQLDQIYQANSLEAKRDLLDAFFLKKYTPFAEPKLLQAVDLLLNGTHTIKVDKLAKQLEISRRTLLRKFRKHTGYSIEEYISVIKFRKALLAYQKNHPSIKLGQIALESD